MPVVNSDIVEEKSSKVIRQLVPQTNHRETFMCIDAMFQIPMEMFLIEPKLVRQ